MRTRTCFYNLKCVQQKLHSILILRLAMAVNDITSANFLLKQALNLKGTSFIDIRYGLETYAIRLEIGHLSAGLEILNDGDNVKIVEEYVPRLSSEAQTAYKLLREALFDEEGVRPKNDRGKYVFTEKFKSWVKAPRDKLAFHYDEKEAQQALNKLIGSQATPLSSIIFGEDIHSSRLVIADALTITELCQVLWEVVPTNKEETEQAIDKIADWCQERAQDFYIFGGELCRVYFEDCSAG